MEANNILFRCSSLGHIMAEGSSLTDKQAQTIEELTAKAETPKGLTDKQKAELDRLIEKRDNPELAEGIKTHLIDVFASYKYSRREEVSNKYLDKGNEREEDSITMVSRLTKTLFIKNSTRLRNNYIQGEPDIFIGESISKAKATWDTKTSWSLHTFLRSKYKKLDPMYEWQGHGYMDLTGAESHTVAFCLVNGTADAILKEKRDMAFKMKVTDQSDPAYKKKCQQIEINHIFDLQAFLKEYPGFIFDNDISKWEYDIPMIDRMHTVTFQRDEAMIRKIHDRVLQCREYMEETFFNKIHSIAA